MSMASLEREILAAAKEHFNNPNLRLKDILEWSTSEPEPKAGEIMEKITDGKGFLVYVCILKGDDKRNAK